jgi:hypothetical protein
LQDDVKKLLEDSKWYWHTNVISAKIIITFVSLIFFSVVLKIQLRRINEIQ